MGGGKEIRKLIGTNLNLIQNILILVLLGSSIAVSAQPGPGHDTTKADTCLVKLNSAHVRSYFSDSWGVLKSPSRWDGRQWATAAVVSGLTAIVYTQDEDIRNFMQRNKYSQLDEASKYFFEPLGSGMISIPLAVGFYAYGALAEDQRAARAGLTGIKAMAVTTVFTYAIKYTAQRHRPHDDKPANPKLWEGPFGSWENTSFPSGHTSFVWAAATVFATEYRGRIWVPIISYTLAGLASVSRVYDDKHWASDVVFGAALGYFIGKFVYKSTVRCPGIVIVPGTSATGHPGFTMTYRLD